MEGSARGGGWFKKCLYEVGGRTGLVRLQSGCTLRKLGVLLPTETPVWTSNENGKDYL